MSHSIKSIAILGAGAIGAYLLYGFQETYGKNLWVIAEGDRVRRLKEEGLVINGVPYRLNVKTPDGAHGVDLLFICLKYGALSNALPEIRRVADENTTVISLMNGVDSEEIISQVIPQDQIIHALIRIASEHRGNRVDFPLPKEHMGIIYGLPEKKNAGPDEVSEDRVLRLEAVRECLEHSRLISHVSDDIIKEIWLKFALNISNNIPQAILSVGVGVYGDSQHALFIKNALRKEVVLLADSLGIDIHAADQFTGSGNTGCAKSARYSTLQDLDDKRPTEIDMFCKTVMRLAEDKGIPVPYNTFAYHLIKALEEKNEGRFEY